MNASDISIELRVLRTTREWSDKAIKAVSGAIELAEKATAKHPVVVNANVDIDGNWEKRCPTCGTVLARRTIDEKDGPLTMDEAITHCYDVAEKHKDCEACCKEHHLLARWLEELRARRKADEFNRKAGSNEE